MASPTTQAVINDEREMITATPVDEDPAASLEREIGHRA